MPFLNDDLLTAAFGLLQVDLVLLGQPSGMGTRLPTHQRILCWALAEDRCPRWQSWRTGCLHFAEQERSHRLLVVYAFNPPPIPAAASTWHLLHILCETEPWS